MKVDPSLRHETEVALKEGITRQSKRNLSRRFTRKASKVFVRMTSGSSRRRRHQESNEIDPLENIVSKKHSDVINLFPGAKKLEQYMVCYYWNIM